MNTPPQTTNKKIISIVVPCFNEEEVIELTVERLNILCKELSKFDIEIIFVDDGSQDKTKLLLRKFSAINRHIKLIFLSRNFGHQLASTAGIDAAGGDAVVLIDADLQDPPEVIHEMIKKWEQGFDVIYGTRINRAGESSFKLVTARFFYRLLNKLSDISIPLDTGDFRLMSRQVINNLKKMPERDRFIRGMTSWIGFKQTSVKYQRVERFAGTSKYPLRKMIRFGVDGILSFSTKPLQISIGLGLISAVIAMLGIIYALFLRIFTSVWVEGWTALIIAVLFIGGVQLLCLGILGEYIGRIYNQIKNRPLYIVDEYINFKK